MTAYPNDLDRAVAVFQRGANNLTEAHTILIGLVANVSAQIARQRLARILMDLRSVESSVQAAVSIRDQGHEDTEEQTDVPYAYQCIEARPAYATDSFKTAIYRADVRIRAASCMADIDSAVAFDALTDAAIDLATARLKLGDEIARRKKREAKG